MCLLQVLFRIFKKSLLNILYNSMGKVNALVFEGGATWGIAYIGALSGSREKT